VEFKKIEAGAFRKLFPHECRILFIRHAKHKNNILLAEAVEKLVQQGQALKRAGIEIAAAVSSPADRCLATVYATKIGLGAGGYTHTDDRLGDFKLENPDLVKKIKEAAKEAGVPAEKFIFDLAQKDKKMHKIMFLRGIEGAFAVLENAEKYPGKTILVASHGGSRMECTILALQDFKKLNNMEVKCFLKRGQIVEIIIDPFNRKMIEINYLAPPE